MKQIAVMSGKGGAGKTSLTAAVAQLFPAVVTVDADVNASNLPILLPPLERLEEKSFFAMDVAKIDAESCSGCGKCLEICAFSAIDVSATGEYSVNSGCEGCAACHWVCPAESIRMQPESCGVEYLSLTENGYLVHADLIPGADNSGKLIASIRESARRLAREKNYGVILIDGPPGTSCQAISSLTGVDLVLVVLEESLSGLSDYLRLAELMEHFRLPHLVVLNKAGVDASVAARIEAAVAEHDGEIAARIPFDSAIPRALAQRETLISLPKYRPRIEHLCEQLLNRLHPAA